MMDRKMQRIVVAVIAVILIITMILTLVAPALAADVASVRTPMAGESGSQRANIALAAEAVDGVRVAYGESFSFNDTVGNNAVSVIIE